MILIIIIRKRNDIENHSQNPNDNENENRYQNQIDNENHSQQVCLQESCQKILDITSKSTVRDALSETPDKNCPFFILFHFFV